MKIPQPDIFIPDGASLQEAIRRSTHLAIGAHQDDLEFMAYHGVAECLRAGGSKFFGVVLTDGAGSARAGEFKNTTDREMSELRLEEQRAAARLAQYSAVVQLRISSAELRSISTDPVGGSSRCVELLTMFISELPVGTVYLHNPFDKHSTHLAACAVSIAALKHMARPPARVWGCEGWRGLDWIPDDLKIVLDTSYDPALAERLFALFRTQILGAKRYDRATIGRWEANATYLSPREIDRFTRASYAVDLRSLLLEPRRTLAEFAEEIIARFRGEVGGALKGIG